MFHFYNLATTATKIIITFISKYFITNSKKDAFVYIFDKSSSKYVKIL